MEEVQVNLRLALKIPAGCPPRDLYWLAEQARNCRKILELGVLHGRSVRAMLDNSGARVWCVDSWRGPGASIPGGPRGRRATEEDYQIFLANIADVKHRVIIFRMTTDEAYRRLSRDFFDMIFIDANHSYEAVRADIINYLPVLKKGGLMCGHDYNKNWPGVVRAVNELIKNPQKAGKALWWTREGLK